MTTCWEAVFHGAAVVRADDWGHAGGPALRMLYGTIRELPNLLPDEAETGEDG